MHLLLLLTAHSMQFPEEYNIFIVVCGTTCDIQEEVRLGHREPSSWPDYETLILIPYL